MSTMSVYEACLAAKGKNTRALRSILLDINLSIFNPIFDKFKAEEPYFILFYILQAYSERSPWVILGVDWLEEKQAIAERLEVPDYMRGWLVELLDDDIRGVIVDYLDFQCKPSFKLLQFKQMQYAKISSAIIKQMKTDEAAQIDASQLFEANKELDKLHVAIDKLEDEIKKKYTFHYIGIEEVLKADAKTSNRFGGKIENSRWINKEA